MSIGWQIMFLLALSMPQAQLPNPIRQLLGATVAETLAIVTAASVRTPSLPLDRPKSENRYVVMLSGRNGAGILDSIDNALFRVLGANIVFCPTDNAKQQRVMAVQLLLSWIRPGAEPIKDFSNLYALGDPVPFEKHLPAITYPLPGVTFDAQGHWLKFEDAPEIVVWNGTDVEAVFAKAIGGSPTVGQFWLTDKAVAGQCAIITK